MEKLSFDLFLKTNVSDNVSNFYNLTFHENNYQDKFIILTLTSDMLQDIDGFDKIKLVKIRNQRTLVNMNTVKINKLHIFFFSGTKLSDVYCYFNNLYNGKIYNFNPDVKIGRIRSDRIVRPIKIKDQWSDGLLMELESSFRMFKIFNDIDINEKIKLYCFDDNGPQENYVNFNNFKRLRVF